MIIGSLYTRKETGIEVTLTQENSMQVRLVETDSGHISWVDLDYFIQNFESLD